MIGHLYIMMQWWNGSHPDQVGIESWFSQYDYHGLSLTAKICTQIYEFSHLIGHMKILLLTSNNLMWDAMRFRFIVVEEWPVQPVFYFLMPSFFFSKFFCTINFRVDKKMAFFGQQGLDFELILSFVTEI